ncbi:hypothetical protein JOB18_025553 [Solea senegalensis]|uniref:Glycosyl hydrolases family 22 (GH22) domain-containing protein n=2 Tax=Solea senegalensis TaxID=28829 RepID=A0AAV6PHH3_SOLSE|nr:hypothetical protein JOB18_025553 [Solea senegalensis]
MTSSMEELLEGEESEESDEDEGYEASDESEDEESDEQDSEVSDEDEESKESGTRSKRSYRQWRPRKRRPRLSKGFYGLFQLADSTFCDSGYRRTRNKCRTDCLAFTDDDITDDIKCFVKTDAWYRLLRRASHTCHRVPSFNCP